jgi:hypothetical protein
VPQTRVQPLTLRRHYGASIWHRTRLSAL